jgi:acyl transferase domain-containing protein
MQDLSRQGVQVKEMQLKGRFHTSAHQKSFQRLKHLCDVSQNFRFPATTRPLVPLRLNVDGKMVNAAEPLHVAAIRSILLDVSDWHRTLSLSLDSLVALSKTTGRKNVMVLGLDDCIPRSIKLNSGIRIERLSGPDDAKRPGFKDGPEYQYPEDAVAVVGMACRYPGADSLEEFWEVIESGRSMLGELPEGRFPTKGLRRDPEGKFRFLGNFLRNVAGFDHRFFKRSSREAASMDPQHRLVLEVAYETLESYGYFNQTSPPKNVGCYMGVATSDYEDNVASHSPTAFSVLGTIRAFTSGRISHFFGWTGPSVVLDTACSSSLVAIHTACKAVIADECSMALAGGVNIITSPTLHQNLAAANFLTSTGGCKAFDSRADGYCRGEGAGLVLLKKLSCAISDGDQILGVIVGSAVNQNDNAYPITVPVSSSQTALYRRVLGLAAMDAQMVSYVEAHGTGTPKGDPTECQSIKEVFGGQERRLHFGSVKGNTGHTEAAAGVAGLIKVLLMIQKRKIPPQASFASLNPNIPPLEADNMAIARTVQPWNAEFKVACVNNYGAAGSNASVIIAQPPVEFDSRHGPSVMCLRYPIIISANTHESLGKYAIAMREFLTRQVSIPNERLLASTAFHLTRRHNSSFPFNAIFSAASVAELDDSLRICAEEPKSKAALAPKPKPVVLVFGGQTSNIIQFSEEVYRGSLVIRTHLDECDLLLREMGLEGIFPGIFKQEPVADVGQLHCMLFSLQYACAVAWIESGLQVQVVIGHSFGQLTALCVAGVLSLQDTLRLISGRASLIKNGWGAEPGSMLLVESKPVEIQKLVRDFTESNPGEPIEIACYNGPSSFVLVGSESAIDAFELTAASEPSSFKLKRLPVTHGFHSRFVDNILPDYLELAQSITYREPRLPIETCSRDESWRYFTAESVAEQSRQPVYFADAVERVARRHGACTWIEAGSSSGIVNMVRRALADPTDHSFHLVKLGVPEPLSALAQTTVDLWKAGVKVQFWPFHRRHHSDYMPLNLPPYQFERTRHWLDYVERRDVAESSSMPSRSVEAKPTLVSFLRYQDPQGRIPEFSVNQSCELYQTLVRGHAMLAKDLCPASLYVEIAASAASHLVPNYLQSTHNPRIENLRMHAPLGIDPSRGMNLTLAPSSSGTWEFSLCSYAVNGDGATEPIRHADGRVAMTATEHGKDSQTHPPRPCKDQWSISCLTES